MKHIIIEGSDRTGKNLLIEGICQALEYTNINIRHFGKPKKGLKPSQVYDYQLNAFNKEAYAVSENLHILEDDNEGYHDNYTIWNRSHLGEYVYGSMYRDLNKVKALNNIRDLENSLFADNDEVYLIYLHGDSNFLMKLEDGDSLSQKIEDKERELQLFHLVYRQTSIKNKLKIKINYLNDHVNKNKILNDVLIFLNIGIENVDEHGKKQ